MQGFNFTSGPDYLQTGDPASGTVISNVSVALTVSGDTAQAGGTVTLGPLTRNVSPSNSNYTFAYQFRAETPQGGIIQNWGDWPVNGAIGDPTTNYSATPVFPVGSVVLTRFIATASTGYFFSSGPSLSYAGVPYGPPIDSPITITGAETNVVAGNTDLLSSTLTGNIVQNRGEIAGGERRSNSEDSCSDSIITRSYYINAPRTYAQVGDIVYTSEYGTNTPVTGWYRTYASNGSQIVAFNINDALTGVPGEIYEISYC